MYNDSFKERYGKAPVAISETVDFTPTNAHIHNEIEMLCIIKGSSVIKISDKEFKAEAGDLFFINPLEVHSVNVSSDSDYYHKCICFDCSLIADKGIRQDLLDGVKAVENVLSLSDSCKTDILQYFEAIYQAVENEKESLLFDTTAYVSLIFSVLLNKGLIRDNKHRCKDGIFSKTVLEYLADHYSENLTSKSIAKELFYTQSYFCRSFKNNFGVAFSNYLNMYRISRAKERLESSREKIIDIAVDCGFSDANYFTRSFKKCTGLSPIKYRKSQNNAKL